MEKELSAEKHQKRNLQDITKTIWIVVAILSVAACTIASDYFDYRERELEILNNCEVFEYEEDNESRS